MPDRSIEQARCAEDLQALEAIIERGLATFVEVGQALLHIRDERLYRATHKTFEDYCWQRWNWHRRYADRLIDAADVAQNLSPMGLIPESERQARVLAPLPPDQQREIWTKALEESSGKVTVKVLEKLIREEAETQGIEMPDQPKHQTAEERKRDEELFREMERNAEYNHKVFNFVRAIETLSNPQIPLSEAAREIFNMDTPDKVG